MGELDALPPLIRALLSPDAYDHAVEAPVRLVQTHISYVLLAGAYAYKIKKPLNLGFLDYSTIEQRRRMCEEEVRLNRRLCPEAYLGVVAVTSYGGGLRIVNTAESPVEYAVKMRRMPDDRMMPHLIAQGTIEPGHVRSLARLLAGFHARSATNEYIASFGRPDALRENWHENFAQVTPYVGRTLRPSDFAVLRDYADETIARRGPLFHRRADARRVRDCHGDLRSDSIVIHEDGSICVMDCIEFSDRIRFGDVAGDVGFLAMDLDVRERRDLADELIGSYLGGVGDESFPLVLQFYKCYRAYVRGKVESLLLDEPEVPREQRIAAAGRARRYFDLALEYARERRPATLIIIVGLTGSGKSFLSNALGGRIEAAILSSDAIRDELSSRASPPEQYGSGRYSGERRAAVYEALRERADAYLQQGESVILDATHAARIERERAYALASRHNARVVVVCVRADDATTRRHLALRADHPEPGGSEGRWEIYVAQREAFEPVEETVPGVLIEVDGGASLGVNVARILGRID